MNNLTIRSLFLSAAIAMSLSPVVCFANEVPTDNKAIVVEKNQQDQEKNKKQEEAKNKLSGFEKTMKEAEVALEDAKKDDNKKDEVANLQKAYDSAKEVYAKEKSDFDKAYPVASKDGEDKKENNGIVGAVSGAVFATAAFVATYTGLKLAYNNKEIVTAFALGALAKTAYDAYSEDADFSF